jgi:DNA-binding NarL/FixJ family response regulator
LVDDDVDAATAIERASGRFRVSVTIAASLADARVMLRQRRVDVVILELRLPDGRGEALLPDIEACPRQPAMIITSAFLPELHSSALEYHPVALSKPVAPDALLRMARTVARGYAEPAMERFIRRFALSNREAEATRSIVYGLKPKETAERMRCSEKTVYAYLARVCAKTHCKDYHEVMGMLLAFTCHVLGHTPPDHAALGPSGD